MMYMKQNYIKKSVLHLWLVFTHCVSKNIAAQISVVLYQRKEFGLNLRHLSSRESNKNVTEIGVFFFFFQVSMFMYLLF